jgi:hypothetical protein
MNSFRSVQWSPANSHTKTQLSSAANSHTKHNYQVLPTVTPKTTLQEYESLEYDQGEGKAVNR